jgi:outer membrane receptor protein involved in Fe transport
MAEDVLKKLPGIDVSMDGKITVEGKEVKRIFINGKEATAGDIRTITQNMPASIISQVQLTNLLSEEAQALGLKESNTEKIINLKLKKEYENGLFGRAAAGGGDGDLYQGSLFSNYMAGSSRITATGYANNTGNADVSNTESANSIRNAGTITAKNININYSYKTKDNKLDLSGTAELGATKNNTLQSSLKRSFLPNDSVLYQSQQTKGTGENNTARFNIRGVYTFSKKTSLNTTLGINNTSNKPLQHSLDTTAYNNPDNYLFTRNINNSSGDNNHGINFSGMLQRNSSKQGRNFVVRYNLSYAGMEKDGLSSVTNIYRNAGTTFNNTTTSKAGYNITNGLSLRATEPVSKYSLVSGEYSIQLYNSEDKRDVSVTNNMGSYRDSVQSNNYKYDFTEHNAGLQYQYNKEDISFNLGLKTQLFDRRNSGLPNIPEVRYSGTNYFPLAGFRYTLSKRSKIDLSYSGSMRAPSTTQVQPAPDYSDSMNVTVGNPNLKPELASSFNLAYNYLRAPKERSLWVKLGYNRTDDKIINNVTIAANKRISMPVNADGMFATNAALGYNTKWKKKYRLRLGLNGSVNRNITITNNTEQQILNYYYQPNIGIGLTAQKLETEISWNFRNNFVTGAGIAGNNRQATHNLGYELKYNLPGSITVAVNLNYTANKGLSAGYNQDFVLANASIYKGFNKPKGLFIHLQGYDLLNNYPNTRRTVTDNIVEDRTNNRIGRYFLLSVIYKFSRFF